MHSKPTEELMKEYTKEQRMAIERFIFLMLLKDYSCGGTVLGDESRKVGLEQPMQVSCLLD